MQVSSAGKVLHASMAGVHGRHIEGANTGMLSANECLEVRDEAEVAGVKKKQHLLLVGPGRRANRSCPVCADRLNLHEMPIEYVNTDAVLVLKFSDLLIVRGTIVWKHAKVHTSIGEGAGCTFTRPP